MSVTSLGGKEASFGPGQQQVWLVERLLAACMLLLLPFWLDFGDRSALMKSFRRVLSAFFEQFTCKEWREHEK